MNYIGRKVIVLVIASMIIVIGMYQISKVNYQVPAINSEELPDYINDVYPSSGAHSSIYNVACINVDATKIWEPGYSLEEIYDVIRDTVVININDVQHPEVATYIPGIHNRFYEIAYSQKMIDIPSDFGTWALYCIEAKYNQGRNVIGLEMQSPSGTVHKYKWAFSASSVENHPLSNLDDIMLLYPTLFDH